MDRRGKMKTRGMRRRRKKREDGGLEFGSKKIEEVGRENTGGYKRKGWEN